MKQREVKRRDSSWPVLKPSPDLCKVLLLDVSQRFAATVAGMPLQTTTSPIHLAALQEIQTSTSSSLEGRPWRINNATLGGKDIEYILQYNIINDAEVH